MKPLYVLAALSLYSMLGTAPAFADPCERSPSSMKVSGMDLDVTRCQLAIISQKLAEQEMMQSATTAQAVMNAQDKAAAEARVRDWQTYFAAYIGAPAEPAK